VTGEGLALIANYGMNEARGAMMPGTGSDDPDVSVVLSTYNRASVLPHALNCLLDQEAPTVRYEVVVVDNNSTDGTRAAVEPFLARRDPAVRYVFEPRQGVAYGRNAGIRAARAPIIAFTDDDIAVARDWIATLKQLLDEHQEVDCVGGRVLPVWRRDPPPWLTREHWAPLALLDYGDAVFHVTSTKRLCLIAANVAFRTTVLEKLGGFAPHVQAVKREVATEDHELLVRLWRSGGQGLYSPALVARSAVADERFTKRYHRRWHTRHGRFSALMGDEGIEASRVGRWLGVPAWIYRELVQSVARWLGGLLRWNPDRAFLHEARLRFALGFIGARWREVFRPIRGRGHGALGILGF